MKKINTLPDYFTKSIGSTVSSPVYTGLDSCHDIGTYSLTLNLSPYHKSARFGLFPTILIDHSRGVG